MPVSGRFGNGGIMAGILIFLAVCDCNTKSQHSGYKMQSGFNTKR
jgi:hypothetical protein